MKLPQASRMGVQQIGTVSPQAAASAAGGTEAILGQAVGQMGKIGMEVYNKKTEWDMQQSKADYISTMRQLDRATSDSEFVSPDEIPEDIEYRRYDEVSDEDGNLVQVERAQIPMYEIYPQMYKTESDRQIQSQGNRIEVPSFRAAWERDIKGMAEAGYTDAVAKSAKGQNKAIRDMQWASVQKAMLERNYDIATEIADTYNGTDEQRRAIKQNIRKQVEMDEYNDYMSEDDVPNMILALDTLQNEEYDRELDSKGRLTYIKALKAQIGTS